MKIVLHFLGSLAIIMAQAIAYSLVYSALHWLFTGEMSWQMFLGGTLAIFLFLFAWSVFDTAKTLYRFHKDPIFKRAHLMTGISWKDYKRLRRRMKSTDNAHYD